MKKSLIIASAIALAATSFSPAFARQGADDPAGHIRGGRGADDPVGHVRQEDRSAARADNSAADVRQSRGADDAPGHIRGGHGADDRAPHN